MLCLDQHSILFKKNSIFWITCFVLFSVWFVYLFSFILQDFNCNEMNPATNPINLGGSDEVYSHDKSNICKVEKGSQLIIQLKPWKETWRNTDSRRTKEKQNYPCLFCVVEPLACCFCEGQKKKMAAERMREREWAAAPPPLTALQEEMQ